MGPWGGSVTGPGHAPRRSRTAPEVSRGPTSTFSRYGQVMAGLSSARDVVVSAPPVSCSRSLLAGTAIRLIMRDEGAGRVKGCISAEW